MNSEYPVGAYAPYRGCRAEAAFIGWPVVLPHTVRELRQFIIEPGCPLWANLVEDTKPKFYCWILVSNAKMAVRYSHGSVCVCGQPLTETVVHPTLGHNNPTRATPVISEKRLLESRGCPPSAFVCYGGAVCFISGGYVHKKRPPFRIAIRGFPNGSLIPYRHWPAAPRHKSPLRP